MSVRKVALLSALLITAGLGGSRAQMPQNLPPPVFNPAQKASLDALAANIKRATRESYARDDWSIFAKLYPPGTFDCWTVEFTDGPYSFLSRPGIPDEARYDVQRIENFMMGGNVDESKMAATHFMEIRYDRTYLAKCGNTRARIYPQVYYFLRQRGDDFVLTHYCPGNPANLPPGSSKKWPMMSTRRAREVVDGMKPSERLDLRRRLLAEPIPLRTVLDIQSRYGLSDDESYFAIERICELGSASQAPH